MAIAARRSPSPGWLLDELSSAGRENMDLDHVARYDEKTDAGAAAEVALLGELGLDAHSQVVDLGAGTGQFALAVAPACARVVAVDISPVMLERLRVKATASAVHNVEVVHAGFVTYQHHGPAADFIYSRWALHHLPDFWKALALHRMRRILRRGGVLRLADVVYSFDPSDAEERIDQWCATLPTDAASDGNWVRADLEEHVRDEHSTFTWLLESMMERSGFRIERAAYTPDGIFAEYVARAL
ncbi:MAG: class I SAM-dependent methyltransferase [Acidimicrobiales bacterium]